MAVHALTSICHKALLRPPEGLSNLWRLKGVAYYSLLGAFSQIQMASLKLRVFHSFIPYFAESTPKCMNIPGSTEVVSFIISKLMC